MKNTHSATEFKIEILKKSTINYYSNSNTLPSIQPTNLWEIVMLCDDGENECFIRDLQPFTTYMLRVSSWNINGWSIPCTSLFFKTKPLSKMGNRLLYLAPSLKYQRMLDENKTSYFRKWVGFHITVGGRHPSGQISASEIAQQLSEMGLKKAQLSIQQLQQNDEIEVELKEYLWKIPHGKWRVLSGKDLIVLGLDDDIPLFSIASKFLDAKKWTNVKHRNFHLTLGLKRDLNKGQIQKLARVLVSERDCVEWEWVSVKERPDGKVIWHQRFPAYNL